MQQELDNMNNKNYLMSEEEYYIQKFFKEKKKNQTKILESKIELQGSSIINKPLNTINEIFDHSNNLIYLQSKPKKCTNLIFRLKYSIVEIKTDFYTKNMEWITYREKKIDMLRNKYSNYLDECVFQPKPGVKLKEKKDKKEESYLKTKALPQVYYENGSQNFINRMKTAKIIREEKEYRYNHPCQHTKVNYDDYILNKNPDKDKERNVNTFDLKNKRESKNSRNSNFSNEDFVNIPKKDKLFSFSQESFSHQKKKSSNVNKALHEQLLNLKINQNGLNDNFQHY